MSLVIKGLPEFEDYLDRLGSTHEDVEKEMLAAMADVLQKEVQATSKEMLVGKYVNPKTGVTQSVKIGKIKKNRDGNLYVDVIFRGKQHGERLATIAFMNEYGAIHYAGAYQEPRPFIWRAIERGSMKASEAAAEVFNKHIENL